MGRSSGGSPPAPGGNYPDTSGNSHRTTNESNDRSSGRSSRNGGQCSDDTGPVIVNGSTPGNKGKQPMRTDPMALATRFLRIPDVQTDDFDPNMLFGRVKALVSTHRFLKLTTQLTHTVQYSFKEDVQKNGVFGIKSDDLGNMTVFMFCDTKSNACGILNKLKHGFRRASSITQQEFEAAEIEIPEEIDSFSPMVMFSATVKQTSLDNHFSVGAITDMAKTAAAKFGKIVSFKLRFHNGGHGWVPTIARFEVEYDSVKDARDAVLNTNTASGICPPHAQAEVSHRRNTCPSAELY
jgi:hypothetical protein